MAKRKKNELPEVLSKEEMINFITSNAESASFLTVRLMYEFFKCAKEEDEKEKG